MKILKFLQENLSKTVHQLIVKRISCHLRPDLFHGYAIVRYFRTTSSQPDLRVDFTNQKATQQAYHGTGLNILLKRRSESSFKEEKLGCESEEEQKELSDDESAKLKKNEFDFVRPYEEIPGPKPLPFFGNSLTFTKYGGYENYVNMFRKLHDKYGPIVRIAKVKKMDFVFIFKPEDIQKLFREEGKMPVRLPLDILAFYRKQRPWMYSCAGLVSENGPEWRRLRSAAPSLLNLKVVAGYRERQAEVTDSLVEAIDILQNKSKRLDPRKGMTDDGYIDDLLTLLFRYTLEAIGIVSLGRRLGCLEEANLQTIRKNSSKTSQIIAANEDSLEAIARSFYTPSLHHFIPTRNYLKLARAQDFLAGVTEDEISRLRRSLELDPDAFSKENPLIASLLQNEKLYPQDLLLLLVEVLQGGIDATATTLAFCIYFVAQDSRLQEALHKEVANFDLHKRELMRFPILKATLKETYRLRPSATAVGRILEKDIVLSGFRVPAGTSISGPPFVASRDPFVFPNPNKFDPFRWIKEKTQKSVSSSSASNVIWTRDFPSSDARKCSEDKDILRKRKKGQEGTFGEKIELKDGNLGKRAESQEGSSGDKVESLENNTYEKVEESQFPNISAKPPTIGEESFRLQPTNPEGKKAATIIDSDLDVQAIENSGRNLKREISTAIEEKLSDFSEHSSPFFSSFQSSYDGKHRINPDTSGNQTSFSDLSPDTSEVEIRRDIHPYAVLPFGHGARMCPGRRFAEQEIYLALIKLIQTYRMEVVGKPISGIPEPLFHRKKLRWHEDQYIGQTNRLNLMPCEPIRIRFIKRI